MKNNIFKKSIGAAALLLIVHEDVWALPFSGDICYSAHITQRETGPVNETFTFKLHVTPLDATTCVAYALVSVSADNPAFVSGICRIGGGLIYLNLNETQAHKDGWRDTEIVQVKLNSATLNGAMYQIAHDFNTKTRTFDEGYASGTLTKIACS